MKNIYSILWNIKKEWKSIRNAIESSKMRFWVRKDKIAFGYYLRLAKVIFANLFYYSAYFSFYS